MFLQPRQTKFKKLRKGRIKPLSTTSPMLQQGRYGIKAMESGVITGRQLEAARQTINRHGRRKGQIWIRQFPHYPITKKPNEVRMGKGKGNIAYWVAKVKAGDVLFEVDGFSEKLVRTALSSGMNKLPLRSMMINW